MKKDGFKIYALRCPITYDIRYIGKTCFPLHVRLNRHLRDKYLCHRVNWMNLLRLEGLNPIITLIKNCENENRCNYSERFYIKLFGRKDLGLGQLLNHTDGGDGSVGYKHTEESRKKIKEKRKDQVISKEVIDKLKTSRIGKNNTPEQNEKIRKAHIGMKPSEETRIKLSECKKGQVAWNKGRTGVYSEESLIKMSESHKKLKILYGPKKLSEEHKRKIGEKSKGRKLSDESKDKISKANKGRKPSKETREKISKAGMGRKASEETRKLISESNMGKLVSEEARIKIGEGNRGKVRSEELKQQISTSLKGRIPWNKGLKKEDRINFLITNRILTVFVSHILKTGPKGTIKLLKKEA